MMCVCVSKLSKRGGGLLLLIFFSWGSSYAAKAFLIEPVLAYQLLMFVH